MIEVPEDVTGDLEANVVIGEGKEITVMKQEVRVIDHGLRKIGIGQMSLELKGNRETNRENSRIMDFEINDT